MFIDICVCIYRYARRQLWCFERGLPTPDGGCDSPYTPRRPNEPRTGAPRPPPRGIRPLKLPAMRHRRWHAGIGMLVRRFWQYLGACRRRMPADLWLVWRCLTVVPDRALFEAALRIGDSPSAFAIGMLRKVVKDVNTSNSWGAVWIYSGQVSNVGAWSAAPQLARV